MRFTREEMDGTKSEVTREHLVARIETLDDPGLTVDNVMAMLDGNMVLYADSGTYRREA